MVVFGEGHELKSCRKHHKIIAASAGVHLFPAIDFQRM